VNRPSAMWTVPARRAERVTVRGFAASEAPTSPGVGSVDMENALRFLSLSEVLEMARLGGEL
jgi:hypothetical protein